MDIVRLCIPYRFVGERTRMSWHDVRFGLVNQLLDPQAAIEMAVDQVAEYEEPSGSLLELAGASKNEPIMELVEQLAGGESPRSEDETRNKWLYLVLAWLYDHRTEDPDPLQRVEEVYADFGYPEHIASFVRYMPMQGPDLGSREANERRLFERWKRYIDEAAASHRE
jgi:hypothetical protein